MEALAFFNCLTTIILGAVLLLLLKRMGTMKHDLSQRISQLEIQWVQLVDAVQEQSPSLLNSASQVKPEVAEPIMEQPLTSPIPTAPEPITDESSHPPTVIAETLATEPPATSSPATPPSATLLPPLLNWFLRTHLMVQIGIVILFIGVAFLLKYVADQGWLSLELRHVLVALGGAVMSGVGWRLRARTRNYGLALQGAGIGVMYMTVFFAFRIYDLLPAGIAFGALALLGAACAGLAVINNARILDRKSVV